MIMAQSKAVATKYKEEKDNEKTKNSIVFDSGHDTGAGRLRGKSRAGSNNCRCSRNRKRSESRWGRGGFLSYDGRRCSHLLV